MTAWREAHPGEQIPDGHVFTQPWPASANGTGRDEVIHYQYRADQARRTMHGIDEQIGKAERAVAGKIPVKRNPFVTLAGADKSVNRTLEAKARALAGIKGYVNRPVLAAPPTTPWPVSATSASIFRQLAVS